MSLTGQILQPVLMSKPGVCEEERYRQAVGNVTDGLLGNVTDGLLGNVTDELLGGGDFVLGCFLADNCEVLLFLGVHLRTFSGAT